MTSRTRLLTVLVSAPVIAFTIIGGVLGHAMARADDTFATLRVFHDVVSLIMSNYVEQPNMDNVMRGAMRGLAEGLDSDSAYLTPPQVREADGGPCSFETRRERQPPGGLSHAVSLGFELGQQAHEEIHDGHALEMIRRLDHERAFEQHGRRRGVYQKDTRLRRHFARRIAHPVRERRQGRPQTRHRAAGTRDDDEMTAIE